MSDSKIPNADLILTVAQAELTATLNAGDSISTKAAAVLGLDGALLVGLAAVVAQYGRFWFVSGVVVTASLVECVRALQVGKWDAGPDIGEFFESFVAADEWTAKAQMVSELNSGIRANIVKLEGRGQHLTYALVLLVLALALAFLLFER